MIMTCCGRLAALFALTLLMGVKDAYTVSDTPCDSPDEKPHDCVKITECTMYPDITLPLLPGTSKMFRKLHCGFEGKVPKICCPRKLHKNWHLLTKEKCGVAAVVGNPGGTTAKMEEYPWMALLNYKKGKKSQFNCTGTLINNKYVLTAANCIRSNLRGVRIGRYNIKTKNKTDCIEVNGEEYCSEAVQDSSIEDTIKHKDYSDLNFNNDIALIRLVETIDLTRANAKPICLPLYHNLLQLDLNGLNMVIAGWRIADVDFRSDELQKVTIPVIDNDQCSADIDYENEYDMQEFLNDKKICAGEENKDSCKGDSGGPLMRSSNYENRHAVVQFGIKSFGQHQSCDDGKLGFYTKVTEYVDWILDNIRP